jgi:hypothetical protein
MSSGGDAAAVSLHGTVRVTNPRNTGVAQAAGFGQTDGHQPVGKGERAVNWLTDGTVCAGDAATGAEIGPSRKSRLNR